MKIDNGEKQTMDEYNVLIAEDTEEVRKAIKGEFEAWGFCVHEARNVDEALEVIQKEKVDAVILDMRMPDEIAGLRLLRTAFHFGMAEASVPIIVFTAYENYENCVRAIKSGAYDYIPKGDRYQNTLRRLVKKCREAIDRLRKPEMPLKEDWVNGNFADLCSKYGGKRIAVFSEELAQECGLERGESVDRMWVVAADSFEELRDVLLEYPSIRDSEPFIALVPKEGGK